MKKNDYHFEVLDPRDGWAIKDPKDCNHSQFTRMETWHGNEVTYLPWGCVDCGKQIGKKETVTVDNPPFIMKNIYRTEEEIKTKSS